MPIGVTIPDATTDEIELTKEMPYQEIIDSLMYLAVTTRPDILFTVARLTQKISRSSHTHWKFAKNIMCYESGTKTIRLVLGNKEENVFGYSDANHASEKTPSKSTD